MSLGRNMSTTLDTTSMCEYAAEWFMARILRQPLEHGQATDVCAKLFDLSDPQVWQAHMTGLVTVLVMVVAFVLYHVLFTGPGKIVNRVVFDLTPTAFFVLVAAVDSSSGDIVGEPLYKLERPHDISHEDYDDVHSHHLLAALIAQAKSHGAKEWCAVAHPAFGGEFTHLVKENHGLSLKLEAKYTKEQLYGSSTEWSELKATYGGLNRCASLMKHGEFSLVSGME